MGFALIGCPEVELRIARMDPQFRLLSRDLHVLLA